MSKFNVRINRPDHYQDMSVEEYENHVVLFMIESGFKDGVMVRELGESGENMHWHMCIVDPKRRSDMAMRQWFKEKLELKGNGELMLQKWDDEKGKNHYQYLAKGPTTQRLVMPNVVVDDLGLMWERLHHLYHDFAASKRRSKKEKAQTFTEQLLEICQQKSVDTMKGIAGELCDLTSRRLTGHDAFWAEKCVWAVYSHVNPAAYKVDFMAAIGARMNF